MDLDDTNSVWATVRIPCEPGDSPTQRERYAETKLRRLALEVLLAFGPDAIVLDPEANAVKPLRR